MEAQGLDAVRKAACGVAAAEQFLLVWFDVCHFFDDVLDRDAEITDATIYRAIWQTLIDLPQNRFYRSHFDQLQPLVAQAILSWRTANALERGADEDGRRIAYGKRGAYADLVTHTALILGGPEHAAEVALDLARWQANESYGTYRRGLAGAGEPSA